MADDQHRAAILAKEIEQPVFGVDVEVVGGFVEQQRIAAGKQNSRQLDTTALATREHTERQIEAVGFQAEAGGN